jgi:hypothetical protein
MVGGMGAWDFAVALSSAAAGTAAGALIVAVFGRRVLREVIGLRDYEQATRASVESWPPQSRVPKRGSGPRSGSRASARPTRTWPPGRSVVVTPLDDMDQALDEAARRYAPVIAPDSPCLPSSCFCASSVTGQNGHPSSNLPSSDITCWLVVASVVPDLYSLIFTLFAAAVQVRRLLLPRLLPHDQPGRCPLDSVDGSARFQLAHHQQPVGQSSSHG